jgi:quinol monooxygenase YgiN
MIRHVVLFQFNEAATGDRVDAYERDLTDYVATLDGVRSCVIGRDAGINPNTFDMAIVAEFADEEAFRAYFDGPRHKEIQAQTADMIAAKAATQSRHD